MHSLKPFICLAGTYTQVHAFSSNRWCRVACVDPEEDNVWMRFQNPKEQGTCRACYGALNGTEYTASCYRQRMHLALQLCFALLTWTLWILTDCWHHHIVCSNLTVCASSIFDYTCCVLCKRSGKQKQPCYQYIRCNRVWCTSYCSSRLAQSTPQALSVLGVFDSPLKSLSFQSDLWIVQLTSVSDGCKLVLCGFHLSAECFHVNA